MMMCPYCFQVLGEKPESGNTASCLYCGKNFCVGCLAKLGPIFGHGPHYHRKSCPLYVENAGTDVVSPTCDECTRLKKVCPRPGELVDGDFPEDELPKV